MAPLLSLYLGLLIFSFLFISVIIVPFINLLYRLKLTHHHLLAPTFKVEAAMFTALHPTQKTKIGTPIGGGILIVFVVTVLFTACFWLMSWLGFTITRLFPLIDELNIIFFTFISFALLGLYDDILKIFNLTRPGSRIRPLRKTTLILILSILISTMLYLNLHINIINIPLFGTVHLGWMFVPAAALIIAFFSKAVDITDGMDGLASGVLLIILIAFWAISLSALDSVLSVFIALWVGSLLAFLYFNIYPARIWLGNAGSLSFGATLAVIAILLGKTSALFIIGSVYSLEAGSQLLQVISVNVFHKPLFPVTPVHYWLQSLGWPEPKIVMRFWLLALLSAMFGLWLTGI